jgi:hypothetical protein
MGQDYDIDDGMAWSDFVESQARLTREQVELFEALDRSDAELRRWALSVLGLSGVELVDKFGCKATNEDRRAAAEFIANAERLRRRMTALAGLVEAASLRVSLALCDEENCPSLRAAACADSRRCVDESKDRGKR